MFGFPRLLCDICLSFGQVIKPSVVGGFENAALISLWAQAKGKLAVVSAAFESSISLSSYVQFACYLEMRIAEIPPAFDKKLERSVAHGLGTYKWLKEDVVVEPLVIRRQPRNGYLGASIDDADNILRNFQINRSVTSENFVEDHVSIYEVTVELQNFCWLIKVQETGQSRDVSCFHIHYFSGFRSAIVVILTFILFCWIRWKYAYLQRKDMLEQLNLHVMSFF